jgi:F-type H+-transporting ATPase subunit a
MSAAAEVKIDPMHQFQIESLGGSVLDGTPFHFTNSALWMLIVLGSILFFMWGGMKRDLVPGRWQAAVESVTGFISGMALTNIGPEGRKYTPWIFTVFIFILFSNLMGMMPFGIVEAAHPSPSPAVFGHRRACPDQLFHRLVVGLKHGFIFSACPAAWHTQAAAPLIVHRAIHHGAPVQPGARCSWR